MFKDVEDKMVGNGTLAEAIALVQRRRMFERREAALVVAAGAVLAARGEPFSREENRLLDVADRLRWRAPAPDPEPAIDPAYDRNIAERAAASAGLELVLQQKRDAWFLADDEYRRTAATRKDGPTARARNALRVAKEEAAGAREAVERAMARLIEAKLARDRARVAAILAAGATT